jgi:hypothetical protein
MLGLISHFLLQKPKRNFKIQKLCDFGGFQLLEVRGGGGSKYRQISIIDFQFVAKNIEGQLKICTSYLVYIWIWLIFLGMITSFFYKQKFLRKPWA